jgi:hypothetical protein
LTRAKSDEGGYLATLADIDSTTLEQGNGSILASKPGSILASAEDLRHQTAQSTVYREELRELAIANAPEWTSGIRCQKANGLHG